MKALKLIPALAFMAIAAVSYAGSPKSEAKDAKPTEANTATTAGANLVWYEVTYDASHPSGYIPSGTAPAITGDKSQAQALGKCPDGTDFDCLRGFNSAPSLPTNSVGNDQIKTDEQPE
ncbi:hypothetical protein ACFJIV_29030 [Mucilaginibacter sp. UC70_90]